MPTHTHDAERAATRRRVKLAVHSAVLALAAATSVVGAQDTTAAVTRSGAQGPPVRPLPRPSATTTEPLMSTSQVRPLSDGRILLNDVTRRRLLLFDSTLKTFKVIADYAAGAVTYGVDIATRVAPEGILDDDGCDVRSCSFPMRGPVVKCARFNAQDACDLDGIRGDRFPTAAWCIAGHAMIFPSMRTGRGTPGPPTRSHAADRNREASSRPAAAQGRRQQLIARRRRRWERFSSR